MSAIRPVFKNVLIAAIVLYVVSTTIIISDLCNKVGQMEFELMHITGKCGAHHGK